MIFQRGRGNFLSITSASDGAFGRGRKRGKEKLWNSSTSWGSRISAGLSRAALRRTAAARVARALATNPKVLLCDEPRARSTPKTTRQIPRADRRHQQSLYHRRHHHTPDERGEGGLQSRCDPRRRRSRGRGPCFYRLSPPKSAAARHLVFLRGADIDVSDPQQQRRIRLHLPQREDDIHSASSRALRPTRASARRSGFGQHAEALRRGVRQHAPRRAERAVPSRPWTFKKH